MVRSYISLLLGACLQTFLHKLLEVPLALFHLETVLTFRLFLLSCNIFQAVLFRLQEYFHIRKFGKKGLH